MRVRCVYNRRRDVTEPQCRQYAAVQADELELQLVYTVYGQLSLVDGGCLMYLIEPRYRGSPLRPSWYPASLFEVYDSSIPSSWVFAVHAAGTVHASPVAVWGYPELATSQAHYAGLIEREEDSLQLFRARKLEIDHEAG